MTDPLELDASMEAPKPRNPNLISPTAVMSVAIIAIAAWMGVAAWILINSPSEAERAAILKQAEAVSFMAFGFFLGSSASSRNKDHQ